MVMDKKKIFISSRLFENEPNKICSHLNANGAKLSKFLAPESSKITPPAKKKKGENERVRRTKRREEKTKQYMVKL